MQKKKQKEKEFFFAAGLLLCVALYIHDEWRFIGSVSFPYKAKEVNKIHPFSKGPKVCEYLLTDVGNNFVENAIEATNGLYLPH